VSDEEAGTEEQADQAGGSSPPTAPPGEPPAASPEPANAPVAAAGAEAAAPRLGTRPVPKTGARPLPRAGRPGATGAKPGQRGAKPGQPGAKPGSGPKPGGAGAQAAAGTKPGSQPPAKAGAQAAGAAAGAKPAGAAPTKGNGGRGAAPGTKAQPKGSPGTADSSERQRESRERRAREIERRKAAEAAAAAAHRKRQTYTWGTVAAVVVVVAALVFFIDRGTNNAPANARTTVATTPIPTATATSMITPSPGPAGPESIPVPNAPVLASTVNDAGGQTVNGVQCNTSEQLAYHHHAHLTIFVNDQPRQVPLGIGIAGYQQTTYKGSPYASSGTCFYWLHTHADDGIIHIESPTNTTYTLGDFFAEWGQPLSATQVGPVRGKVVAFYNGQLFTGSDPATLPLTSHAQIQLDVNTSSDANAPLVAPESITDWQGL
jgi:hypothetical protein